MILALGAFDGYHLGHQQLFRAAAQMANKLGTYWTFLTLDPHPVSLTKDVCSRFLFTTREKELLRKWLGIPEPIILPFTKSMMNDQAQDFLDFLKEKFHIQGLVVGHDYHFGVHRSGDAEFLRQWCVASSVDCHVVLPVGNEDEPRISSTQIRHKVELGQCVSAWNDLGYPWFIDGTVISGFHRGKKMGLPTANMSLPPEKVCLVDGVYSTATLVGQRLYPSATSWGVNLTFGEQGSRVLETRIMDFDGDLYGREITVFFLKKRREMQKFSSIEVLRQTIERDCEESQYLFCQTIHQLTNLVKEKNFM